MDIDATAKMLKRYHPTPRRVIVTAASIAQAKRFQYGSVIDMTYNEWRMPCLVYMRRGVRVFLREVMP